MKYISAGNNRWYGGRNSAGIAGGDARPHDDHDHGKETLGKIQEEEGPTHALQTPQMDHPVATPTHDMLTIRSGL